MITYDINLKDEIKVYPTTNELGAYTIGFSGWLPASKTIKDCNLLSFLGEVETTAYLIDPGSVTVVSDTEVQFKLQWPVDSNGKTYPGNHKLVAALTFQDDSTDESWAYPVQVKNR